MRVAYRADEVALDEMIYVMNMTLLMHDVTHVFIEYSCIRHRPHGAPPHDARLYTMQHTHTCILHYTHDASWWAHDCILCNIHIHVYYTIIMTRRGGRTIVYYVTYTYMYTTL